MPLQLTTPQAAAYLKTLFFGPGGYGKTVLMGTANLDPRTAPMLLLDFEGNTESLLGLDIDIIQCKSLEDISEVHTRLIRGELHSQFPQYEGMPFKSVGIDSISEVNLDALREEILRKTAYRMAKGDDPNYAQIQDYGVVLNQMRRIIRVWRDLPMHIFFTAIDDSVPEPGEGTVKIPLMLGAMKREIGALMSVVGCLAIKEENGKKERTLLLHDIPKYRVKVRSRWGDHDSIPTEVPNPTITKLLDYILQTKEPIHA